MTNPRNEVFLSLGDGEEDSVELTVSPVPPAPPAPTAGMAEIIPPVAKPVPSFVGTPVAEADFDAEIEKAKKEYIQQAKKNTLERYEIQESRRAPRIQIDQRVVLAGWVFSVAVAFLTSAIVSFNGITSVAVFVGLSQAWMASLFFFFIELMYLLFLLAYLILSSRTNEEGKKESTAGAIAGMVFFAGVAVAANGFHTFDFWEWDFVEPRAWAGFVLSIAAPLAIISISKMASRVVFASAVRVD
jgi:hypothetical protein